MLMLPRYLSRAGVASRAAAEEARRPREEARIDLRCAASRPCCANQLVPVSEVRPARRRFVCRPQELEAGDILFAELFRPSGRRERFARRTSNNEEWKKDEEGSQSSRTHVGR